MSRVKNHFGFPFLSLEKAKDEGQFALDKKIEAVVVGSHGDPNNLSLEAWVSLMHRNFEASWRPGPKASPGVGTGEVKIALSRFNDQRHFLHWRIESILESLGIHFSKLVFVNHHDSHSASAIGGSGFSDCLSFSLDGYGDYESGAVQEFTSGKIKDFARISEFNSLGRLYSAVTSRYGFTPLKHEGKVTGLAALGNPTPALDYLLEMVSIVNGTPKIKMTKNKFDWILNRLLIKLGVDIQFLPTSPEHMVEIAVEKTQNFADLAYAVQEALEKRIVEFISFWLAKSKTRNVCLSGGVFANVKINQVIHELPGVDNLYIFPAMGDSGLAAGGVWRFLLEQGKDSQQFAPVDMFLGPEPHETKGLVTNSGSAIPISSISLNDTDEVGARIAGLIDKGFTVGIVDGRLEFGPRALCHRSILADPRRAEINRDLNLRLRRTEFMPFAPVIMQEYANEILDLPRDTSLDDYSFMTLTCRIKPSWRNRIAAVVHVDGTARPQVIHRNQSQIMHSILNEFRKLTGIPLLINTSFNAHEEPIIGNLEQAKEALMRNIVDFVISGHQIFARQDMETMLRND